MTDRSHKSYEKALGVASFALFFSSFLAVRIVSRETVFILDLNKSELLIALFCGSVVIALLVLAMYAIIAHFSGRYIKSVAKQALFDAFCTSFLIAFLFAWCTATFFRAPGGFLWSGGPGILGMQGNIFLDVIVYFCASLLIFGIVRLKNRFHRYAHVSTALFVIALAISVYELYFIFSVAP